MMITKDLHRHPNIILIAGTGRNVGKTTLACKIIETLSPQLKLTAVKTTNHFHTLEKEQKLTADTANYRIAEEMLNTRKDSSRMKKAGATASYYIQSRHNKLYEAIKQLPVDLNKSPVIIESGGLHDFIKPGLFFLVEGITVPVGKSSYYRLDPIITKPENGRFNIDPKNIVFKNNCFTYNTPVK